MENNIHNDGLEDFLRKSFEDYDDSPSDGLWDKIDADLADKPKVVPIGPGRRWWIGAAAAVLLTLVVGQYIYFQKEKAGLVEIINRQADKIMGLEKELKEQKKNFAEISNQETNKQEVVFNDTIKKENVEINGQKTIADFEERNVPKNIYQKEKKENIIINTQPEYSAELKNAVSAWNANSTTAADQQKTTAPNPLGLIGLKNIVQPVTGLYLPAMAIDPVSTKGNFSIGVHHSYLSTREKMARVIQRPMLGPDRVFNNTKAMTGTTQMTGISTIYQTKNNWLFGSGVNYRRTMLSTNHRAQLRFMDRQPNGNSQQHDFEYALNTSAGLVDIEVRADQTDPTQTINEFENIIIEIEAKQTIDYVGIPLLVGKQIGTRRLNTDIKTGMLINFLTHQSFDISGNIINNRLRNSRANFSRRNGLGLKSTTVDFMAAVGLNYELNRKWSAHISPTIVVPMGNRHNDPYIKTSGFSAGVDFGFNYKF